MNLEDQLRDALRREDPPEGFADRVMQSLPHGSARKEIPSQQEPRKPRFRWIWPAAAFATAVTMVFSVAVENRRRAEERAGRQAILALQIAAEKLNLAREALNK